MAQQVNVSGDVHFINSNLTSPGQGLGSPLSNVLVNFLGSPALPPGSCSNIITDDSGYQCTFGGGPSQQVLVRPKAINNALDNNCGVDKDDLCWMQAYSIYGVFGGATINLPCGTGVLAFHHSSLIAADVNQSGNISGSDVVLVKDMIFQDPNAANYPSHFFYPQGDDIALQLTYQNAGGYPLIYYREDMLVDGPNPQADFYGVKVGDPIGSNYCTNPIARQAVADPNVSDVQEEMLLSERSSLPLIKGQVNDVSLDIASSLKNAHMLSARIILGESHRYFVGVESNLDLVVERSFRLVGDQVEVILLAEKSVSDPYVKLVFDNVDSQRIHFDEIQVKEFKVYTKEGMQDYRVDIDVDIAKKDNVVQVGSGVYLADKYIGEIVVYNNLGARVASGSSRVLTSLDSGMYIVQTVSGSTHRIVITQ